MRNLRPLLTGTLMTAILGCSQAPPPPASTPVSRDTLDGKTGIKVQSTPSQEGTIDWFRQFGTSFFEQALGTAVDATGVYVAGLTGGALPGQSNSGGTDVFVRKYDFSGNVIWTRQFGTPTDDLARRISVDAGGVYVTGLTHGTLPGQVSSGDRDAFVRKYDADGNELWTRQFGSLCANNG